MNLEAGEPGPIDGGGAGLLRGLTLIMVSLALIMASAALIVLVIAI